MTTYNKTREASKLLVRLEDIQIADKTLWWEEAEVWHKLKRKSLYKYAYGTDLEDREKAWRSFVAETGTPLSTADYKEKCYRRYIIELGFSKSDLMGINPRKLQDALPHISEKNCEEIISSAKVMSKSDFRDWLLENMV